MASFVLNIILFAAAVLVFGLWFIRSDIVEIIFPNTSPITAFALILLLLARHLLPHKPTRRVAQALIGLTVAISILALIEQIFHVDLRVNQLFVFSALADAPHLFAPSIAVVFILFSAALFFPDTRLPNRDKWGQLFIISVMTIAGIALLGHLYDVEQFYQTPGVPPMSLTTTVLVLLTCFVLLFPERDRGFLALMTTSGSAGVMMRRVLPLIIVFPHILGLLFVRTSRTQILPIAAGTVLSVIIMEVVLIGVFWWNAQTIDRIDHERSRLERTLREGEARYRALFEHSSDMIVIIDDQVRYIDANPQAERLTGYSRDELLSPHVSNLMAKAILEDRHEFFEQFKKEGYIGGEYLLKRKDGEELTVDFSATIIAPGVYQAVLHDITAYKQVEEKLRRALDKERELNELKSRFVSIVSHEFRTPLSIIRSSSDLMLMYKDRMTNQQRQDRLENIQTQVTHMSELLEDVLTLGKAGAVGLDFRPQLIDLNAFCKEVIAAFSLTTPSYEIVFTGTDSYAPATVDTKLLRQALTNLLSNAVKYSPNEKQIYFDLECRSAEAVIRIRDFGIGIPEEDQARLFDHFQRASNVGDISGTGLGLAIVKQAVEAHGGRIQFRSGHGTTFIVVLPSFQEPIALVSPDRSVQR